MMKILRACLNVGSVIIYIYIYIYGYAMSKFLPTSRFKWIDLKEFDLNKYTSNNSKGSVLEVDL